MAQQKKGGLNRFALLLIGIFGLIGIVATNALVQQRQDNRQRASTSSSYLKTISLPLTANSIAAGSSGNVEINVLEAKDIPENGYSPLLRLKLSGILNGLTPNKIYRVQLCRADGVSCETDATPEIKTDSSGNVAFDNLYYSGFSNKTLNQFKFIKITEHLSAGPVPSNSCNLITNPCLQATWSEGTTTSNISSNTTKLECSDIHSWVGVKHIDMHVGRGFVQGGATGVTTTLRDTQTGTRVKVMYASPGKSSLEIQTHGNIFEPFSTLDLPVSINFLNGRVYILENWEGDLRSIDVNGVQPNAILINEQEFPAMQCEGIDSYVENSGEDGISPEISLKKSPCSSYGDLYPYEDNKSKPGDGLITADDIKVLNEIISRKTRATREMQTRADVNGDRRVDRKDLDMINSYINGDIETFTVCSVKNGR